MTFASTATLTGGTNTFNLTINVPYTLVPSLAGNTSFEEVAIAAGTISSGTLALNLLGTNTSTFYYEFPSGFTVGAGGTMTVAANVPPVVLSESTLSDAGTVTFTSGDQLSLSGSVFSVSGSLTANGTNFLNTGGGSYMTFTSTATLSGGTNTFNLTINVPYNLVPSLAGNTSFDEVAIENGTISSGTLALNLLGTNTSNFYYEFPNGFTVAAGGTMTVGANVPPVVLFGSTLSDAGTVTFSAGNQLSMYGAVFSVSGSLTANGTSFVNTGDGSYMTFTSTATLSGGTNTFNLPINVPYNLVPSLAGNTSFDEVAIENGTISSGTLALNLLGTDTSTFYYEFPSGFTVAAGGTMTVGANVPPVVLSGSTLSDAGTVTFSAGNQLSMYGAVFSVSGSLTANGTSFVNTGDGSYMVVNSGGDLVASGSSFSLQQLTLASGSTDNLQYVGFSTQLTINSGATIDITSDDFTNGTVVASGNANATISLINNFWGTINPTQIAAKITDHANNSNLPYVTYDPFLSENATATYASNASVIYSPNARMVTLSATVSSADGPVTGGTETFTILSGSTDAGTPITENVVNGSASGTYTIPAGALGGVYTIQAIFSGTSTLLGSSDSSHTLTISEAATTTAASSATTTFSTSNQTISLSATVTSSAGIVNEGTETFTILSGTTPVGIAATAGVSNGAVTASYTLPGGTPVGTYTIEAVYNGTVDFGTSTDTSQSLTINASTTIVWNTTTAPTGGDWDTPGNWVGGAVPTAASNVVIDLTNSGTVTHSTGANDAALSLTTNGNTSLSIGSGSIAIGDGSSSLGSVTIGSGASLSVAAGASVLIQGGYTITDNGAMNVTGASIGFVAGYSATTQILVNGTLSASGSNFYISGSNYAPFALLQVDSGGELTASTTTFSLNELNLVSGSILNSGDLTNDTFNLPIYVPFQDVALLSNNKTFQNVNIIGGTMASGQSLSLVPIGTVSTASLVFIFQGNFTVGTGATLTVGTGTSVLIDPVTITDNGAMNVTGASIGFVAGYEATTQILVNGTLSASGSNFYISGSNYAPFALLQVDSGGELTASTTTFSINELSLVSGSILNTGDLTNDTFNLPIYVPFQDVALLSNNKSFQNVNIIGGTMASGQSLSLVPIGTVSTAGLVYVFQGNFTVGTGATLTVGTGTSVLIDPVTAADITRGHERHRLASRDPLLGRLRCRQQLRSWSTWSTATPPPCFTFPRASTSIASVQGNYGTTAAARSIRELAAGTTTSTSSSR